MMSSNSANNLLDEALGFNDECGGGGGGLLLLIEDRVETSGAFILHHLIKRRLSSPNRPNDVVVFLSFAHPFSHYDRILRKMGCNLGVQKENKRFVYYDMLNLNYPVTDGEKGAEDLLLSVYGKIQKTVELCSSREGYKNSTIMIDDISLMEVALCGSSNLVLDFLHYCYSLATQFDCLVIILNHEDVYSTVDVPSPLLQMEYLANIVIKAEPLATGLATDVHGQLTVLNKGICQGSGCSKSKIRNFHFRVKENCVEYFYPGSRT
ncbi:elongator complex protein 6-like isoform X1 [Coffea arabica]|uniref:Elongator complex protein 6-like isoform X1 n=1 Tax=Coffea arabica TaxID=13443 RepID=A0A6P6U8F5_COFAR|nr:elongator complex protein 6-like isoform X1 [Coffea arabica]